MLCERGTDNLQGRVDEFPSRVCFASVELVQFAQSTQIKREPGEVVGADKTNGTVPREESEDALEKALVEFSMLVGVISGLGGTGPCSPAITMKPKFVRPILGPFRMLVVVGEHVGVTIKTERDAIPEVVRPSVGFLNDMVALDFDAAKPMADTAAASTSS